jgi:hypothetical protein
MTLITCGAGITVTGNSGMGIVHLGLEMTGSGAGKHLEIGRIGMTVAAKCPPALVSSGIDREILAVMVKG